MIKAVIIDDETSAIHNLNKIIKNYCTKVEVVGTANGVVDGIKLIHNLAPDLVFLDIQMPDGTGFDMLECIQHKNFDVIFVTSYNQHAIRAFKYSAIDYLLKPVDIDDLIAAVERISKQKKISPQQESFMDLFENLKSTRPGKLAISSLKGKEYFEIRDILRLEAKGSYTEIYLMDERKIVATRKIKEFEEILSEHHFLRVHNSHIINLKHVVKYTKHTGGWIELTDGSEVPLARRKKSIFDDMMQRIPR